MQRINNWFQFCTGIPSALAQDLYVTSQHGTPNRRVPLDGSLEASVRVGLARPRVGLGGGASSAPGGTFGGLRRPRRSSLFGLKCPRSSHCIPVPRWSRAFLLGGQVLPGSVPARPRRGEFRLQGDGLRWSGAGRPVPAPALGAPVSKLSKGPAAWESRGCGSCWSAPAAGSARRRWRARCWPWVSFRRSAGARGPGHCGRAGLLGGPGIARVSACPACSPALLILGSVCASCASVLPAE